MSPRMVIPPLLLLSLLAGVAPAQFIRQTTSDAGESILQTRVTTYTHPAGVSVIFIASVHVGETSYYDAIRDALRDADVVIHEGARLRAGARSVSFDFATRLGLAKQTSRLKLLGERYVRADLDELAPAGTSRAPESRRELADGLLQLERDPAAAQATVDAYSIIDRNSAALQTLRHRLARGDKMLVLLYGAAHAPDLDRRLRDDFGFAVMSSAWLTAFPINPS